MKRTITASVIVALAASFVLFGTQAAYSQCSGETRDFLLRTVVGGYKGDGAPATPGVLQTPRWLYYVGPTSLAFSEFGAHRIRTVDEGTSAIADYAGRGETDPLDWGDGGPAVDASLFRPGGIVGDMAGNVYIADFDHHVVRMVNPAGTITTFAGTGYIAGIIDGEGGDPQDDRGDGGDAASCTFVLPHALAYDGNNNYLYVVEDSGYQDTDAAFDSVWFTMGNRIRRIDLNTNIIETFAGTGYQTASMDGDENGGMYAEDNLGDGGPAAQCTFSTIFGMTVDPATGDLYLADVNNQRVRKVTAATGNISTVIGNGVRTGEIDDPFGGNPMDNLGDNGLAIQATLWWPSAVGLDGGGSLYVADMGNARIRMVDNVLGNISTVIGVGTPGFSGDGGAAAAAQISDSLWGLLVNQANGDIVFSDAGSGRIRKVSGGIINSIAGGEYLGEGVPATEASLMGPYAFSFNRTGEMYLSDLGHAMVRMVDGGGIITTIAGNGTHSWSIDGQDSLGGVDPTDDIADGVPATSTTLRLPVDARVDDAGNVYIAEWGSHRIRVVTPAGIINTFAGPDTTKCLDVATAAGAPYFVFTGAFGGHPYDELGDGGPPSGATFISPSDIDIGPGGDIYIADGGTTVGTATGDEDWGGRIRMINAAGTTITTVAGNGVPTGTIDGEGGVPDDDVNDGMPATQASLHFPRGVAVDPDGNIYIADMYNARARMVDAATGVITTIGGTGYHTWAIDGSGPDPLDDLYDSGPATSVSIRLPWGIGVHPTTRAVYVADSDNNRVRRIASGNMLTAVGEASWAGHEGFFGDNQPAGTPSMAYDPVAIAYNSTTDEICFSDRGNGRIRCIEEQFSSGSANMRKGDSTQILSGADQLPEVSTGISWPWPDPETIDSGASPAFYFSDIGGMLKVVKTDPTHLEIACQ